MADAHGECLCGGVSFDIVGEPETRIQCFCNHCQKNAGAPFQLCAKFNKDQITINKGQDLLREYVLKDTLSGHDKYKVFCGSCGCTLWTVPTRHGGQHFVVRTAVIEGGLQKYPPNVVLFASRTQDILAGKEAPKLFATMPGF